MEDSIHTPPSHTQDKAGRVKVIKQRLITLLAVAGCIGVVGEFMWGAQQQNIFDADQAHYYTPAVKDYQVGRYAEAVNELLLFNKKQPGSYEGEFLMGQSLLKLKRYEEANRSFRAAIYDDSKTSHRFGGWEKTDAAQRQINRIDRLTAPPAPRPAASADSLFMPAPPTPAQQAADRAAQKQSERTQKQILSLAGALLVIMFIVGWVFTRPPSPDRIKMLWKAGIVNSIVLAIALWLGFSD